MDTTENIAEKPVLRKPQKPFYFNTSEHLLRIGRQRASNLSELHEALQTVPDDSIFQHTASDRRSTRPLPASVLTPLTPPPSPHLDDYKAIVGQSQLDTLRYLAKELKGKTVKMVNSTAVGGEGGRSRTMMSGSFPAASFTSRSTAAPGARFRLTRSRERRPSSRRSR
jgi:hypothetical protein